MCNLVKQCGEDYCAKIFNIQPFSKIHKIRLKTTHAGNSMGRQKLSELKSLELSLPQ